MLRKRADELKIINKKEEIQCRLNKKLENHPGILIFGINYI
jgi:hypothetical protein